MTYTWTERFPYGTIDADWANVCIGSAGSFMMTSDYDQNPVHSHDAGTSWTEGTIDYDGGWQQFACSSDGTYVLGGENPGKLYLSSNSAGTFTETQPAGTVDYHWAPVAVDSDGSNMVAGGYYNFDFYPARLWLSTNYGASWSEIRPSGDANRAWVSLAVDADASVIAAMGGVGFAGYGRVYLSTNSGANWSEKTPTGTATDYYWIDVDCDYSGSIILAANTGPGNLYLSKNAGSTWTEVKPAGNTVKWWQGVAVSGDGAYLFACEFGDVNMGGGRVYYSYDCGDTWHETFPAGDNNREWGSIDTDYDGSVLILSETGGGETFGRLFTGIRDEVITGNIHKIIGVDVPDALVKKFCGVTLANIKKVSSIAK